jgi:hypothetical protein
VLLLLCGLSFAGAAVTAFLFIRVMRWAGRRCIRYHDRDDELTGRGERRTDGPADAA